jgi:hypothetical protein
MRVFLCHASEDREAAERIQLALIGAGFDVFFDEQSLPPGSDYQARIREALNLSDFFVFLATSHALAKGKYTLTELSFARKKWPHPAGRVIAVNVDSLLASSLPNYLQAATLLTVEGNLAAEVRAALEDLRSLASIATPKAKPRPRSAYALTGLALSAIVGATIWYYSDEDLNRNNLIDTMRSAGISDIHLARESSRVIDSLNNNGIRTKRQLQALIEDSFVVAKLKQIYVEELKRDSTAPIDGVGLAVYGSYLRKHNATWEAERDVRNAIRQSPEYPNHPVVRVPVNGFPDRTIIKSRGPELYIMDNGKKRLIPDPDTWEFLGYPQPVHVNDDDFARIATGSPLESMRKTSEGRWVPREDRTTGAHTP